MRDINTELRERGRGRCKDGEIIWDASRVEGGRFHRLSPRSLELKTQSVASKSKRGAAGGPSWGTKRASKAAKGCLLDYRRGSHRTGKEASFGHPRGHRWTWANSARTTGSNSPRLCQGRKPTSPGARPLEGRILLAFLCTLKCPLLSVPRHLTGLLMKEKERRVSAVFWFGRALQLVSGLSLWMHRKGERMFTPIHIYHGNRWYHSKIIVGCCYWHLQR